MGCNPTVMAQPVRTRLMVVIKHSGYAPFARFRCRQAGLNHQEVVDTRSMFHGNQPNFTLQE